MPKKERKIIFKTPEQIKNIRQSGKLLNELLYILYNSTKVGVNLLDLEKISEDFMRKNNVKGAFKGFEGYPANLCLSVNECVVHGIPYNYNLKNGDLLKIDSGVTYKGGISDSAISIIVGGELANPIGYTLVKSTKNALDQAIKKVGPGKLIYDYSNEVSYQITKDGFSILKTLTGHGVGVEVHEPPHIYNYPHENTKKTEFQPNMVVCFEPITAISSTDIVEKKGQPWNLYTKKGDFGAQREYMLLITENGYEILSGITENII